MDSFKLYSTEVIFLDYILELLNLIILIGPILLSVAFVTVVERKLLAAMQKRVGPNYVGPLGLLQAFADAAKLILKEFIQPKLSNRRIFNFSPIVSLVISLLAWLIIPFCNFKLYANLNLGILYIFALSSLHVYGIIMAGWSSNSRYAFLGSLRSASQMISYEVSIGLILISILLLTNSLNLLEIIYFQKYIYFVFPFFPLFILFFISAIAETSRTPFDLPEAEGELVAGYNVEYSSSLFALFFISEYSNIILMSILIVNIFLGGFLPLPPTLLNLFLFNFGFMWPLNNFTFSSELLYLVKVTTVIFTFIWVRATLPRYRYDQLMKLGWKILLPLSIFFIFLTLLNLFIISYI